MQFASIVAAAGIGLGCCNAAIGQGEQSMWQEAQSLRELPPGIQVLLGVGLGAHDGGIADRGEAALIAVEQGGRGYAVAALEFKQTGTTWAPVRCAFTGTLVPHRGNELLEAFAAHPAHNPLACRFPGAVPVAADPGAGR
jgi:hypothetical protein